MTRGWTTVALGEILTPRRQPVSVEDQQVYEQVTVRIRGRGLASRGKVHGRHIRTKRQFAVAAGQLVTSKIDARNGAFGLVPPELDGALVSGDFLAFDIARESCLPQYLDVYVRRPTFWEQCELVSEGSTNRVRLVPEQFLDLAVELPPLEEQRRIVSVLALVDRRWRSLQEERSGLDRLRRALWAHSWEELLSGGAELLPAVEVADVLIGATPSRRRREYYEGGDIPWLKTGEIRFNEIDDTEEKITAEAHAASATKLIPPRTVVMAMKGQGATRGRVAIINREMTTNEAVVAFVPRVPLDERFLFHWFWSQYTATRELGDGTSQPNMNREMVQSLDVLYADLEAQTKVADRLDRVLALERQVDRQAAATVRLRSALLEHLIGGGTRAPGLAR